LQAAFADINIAKDQYSLLLPYQPVEFMGQGKHQMEVSHRQKLSGLFLQPLGFGRRLAFGTVAPRL
jgi:hypothetical protein